MTTTREVFGSEMTHSETDRHSNRIRDAVMNAVMNVFPDCVVDGKHWQSGLRTEHSEEEEAQVDEAGDVCVYVCARACMYACVCVCVHVSFSSPHPHSCSHFRIMVSHFTILLFQTLL